MSDLNLWETLGRVLAGGLRCVCCTIIETRGSTPQKAGASMLVFADGTQAGTLGGGCVEAEVLRRALRSLVDEDPRPAFHTFLLDSDYGWDDGLICGGRMTVLADPVGPDAAGYFAVVRQLTESGEPFAEIVAMDGNPTGERPGSRHLIAADGRLLASRPGPLNDPRSLNDAVEYCRSARPLPRVRVGFAILPQWPRIRLLIIGGGHVGLAVAQLAADCDFEIWVADDRESIVSEERFPQAARRISGEYGKLLTALAAEVTPTTYCLIVSRGHSHDEEALFHLAATDAGYVGMIGSKRKIRLIFDDLLAKGILAEQLARVRAPVGVLIGSRTVPEIAVSIVAELIAVRNGTGVSPVHSPPSTPHSP